jgi:uncharacterized protein
VSDKGGKPREVLCPQCGKKVAWVAKNRFRPFCSERCKLIDLGLWAAEDYRIPVEGAQPPVRENEAD